MRSSRSFLSYLLNYVGLCTVARRNTTECVEQLTLGVTELLTEQFTFDTYIWYDVR